VGQSKACNCFGYMNCNQCFKDCLIQCNWFTLCCHCSRCLAGTCQCCKAIGMIKCLHKIGCNQKCISVTCRKDSALCIMFFNGLIVMLAAIGALVIAMTRLSEFRSRSNAADELGTAYTCVFNDKTTAGEDIAENFKLAMQINTYVYSVLIFGCFLSCISGPVILMRWVALPFHCLLGLMVHIFAISMVFYARDSPGGDHCAIEGNAPDEVVADALFLKEMMASQWYMALIFTILVSSGCRQPRLRDNVVLKKQHEQRENFI